MCQVCVWDEISGEKAMPHFVSAAVLKRGSDVCRVKSRPVKLQKCTPLDLVVVRFSVTMFFISQARAPQILKVAVTLVPVCQVNRTRKKTKSDGTLCFRGKKVFKSWGCISRNLRARHSLIPVFDTKFCLQECSPLQQLLRTIWCQSEPSVLGTHSFNM